jgi:hypothetical protein
MASFRSPITRTTAALMLASGMAFSACSGPQPKLESHKAIEMSEYAGRVKGAKLSSKQAATKAQRRFMEDFMKKYDGGKYGKPFSNQMQGDRSTVTVEFFATGKHVEQVDEMITGRKKEVVYEIPPRSDVAKVIVMFNEPVQFNNAWGIANELYNRQFVMYGGEEPVFKPEYDNRMKFTGNVETIVFWVIKEQKKK